MLCTVIYCLIMQPTLFKLPPRRSVIEKEKNRAFSNDVTAAVLVFQKHQNTATMLVFQTNPVGDDLFSYVSAFFRSKKSALMLATRVKTLHR